MFAARGVSADEAQQEEAEQHDEETRAILDAAARGEAVRSVPLDQMSPAKLGEAVGSARHPSPSLGLKV